MDKELRLAAIKQSAQEYAETKERLLFASDLALKSSEWIVLRTCAEKLIAIENLFAVLNSEANQLQELVKIEREQEVLEAIT